MGRTREYLKRLDRLEEAKEAYAEKDGEFAQSKLSDIQKAAARGELGDLLDEVQKRLEEVERFYDTLPSDSKTAHSRVQEWQRKFLEENRRNVEAYR